jgi:hypothetical protein
MDPILHENEIECLHRLDEIAERLNPVLEPWGFRFQSKKAHWGHRGAWADGDYVRGRTHIHINLSYRKGLFGIWYFHRFPEEWAFSWHFENYVITHEQYMSLIGHGEDSLFALPVSRDGGDPIDALIHDLTKFAAPTLAVECEEFGQIVRQGVRLPSSVEWKEDGC